MRTIIVLTAVFFLICSCAMGQTTVTLKSGEKVEGKITEKTDEYIKLDTYGITLTYWMDEIEKIQGSGDQASKQPPGSQPQSDEKITITGTVYPGEWEKGRIIILAFDSNDVTTRKVIGRTIISEPGPYALKVPSGTDEVYLSGFNDSDADGFKPRKEHDYVLTYGDTSGLRKGLPLPAKTVGNVNFQLRKPSL